MTTLALPYPKLAKGRFASIEAYSDDDLYKATGIRIAFTCRGGGVSKGSYASLNLGTHVNDCLSDVEENRRRVLQGLATPDVPLLVPNQVHGDTVLTIDAQTDVLKSLVDIAQGADGLVVDVPRVAALLCYADCVPVILVSPGGCFSVVHAGWRGVMNTIVVKAALRMAQLDKGCAGKGVSDKAQPDKDLLDKARLEDEKQITEASFSQNVFESYNVYIGPHIRRECFETSEELHDLFIETFGASCDAGYRHIDLSQALITQLTQVGISPDRICDLGLCTMCHTDEFFSYRAEAGVTGRHGAFAYKERI